MDSSKAESSGSISPMHNTTGTERRCTSGAFGTLEHLDLTSSVVIDYATLESHGSGCYDAVAAKVLRAPFKAKPVLLRRPYISSDHRHIIWEHLVDEMRTWFGLKHSNIHPFIGFVLGPNIFFLVSDWENRGFLSQYIARDESVDVKRLTHNIASGLDYLHDQNIVHGDIRLDNILLSDSGTAVICDSIVFRATVSAQRCGFGASFRWMAPELVDSDLPDSEASESPTKSSDVWSFGMTIYELLSRQVPYAHVKVDHRVLVVILRGELPRTPSRSMDHHEGPLYRTFCSPSYCWNRNPLLRPDMKKVLSYLDERDSDGGTTNARGEVSVEDSDHRPQSTASDLDAGDNDSDFGDDRSDTLSSSSCSRSLGMVDAGSSETLISLRAREAGDGIDNLNEDSRASIRMDHSLPLNASTVSTGHDQFGSQRGSNNADSYSLIAEIASETGSLVLSDPDGSTNNGHEYFDERDNVTSEGSCLDKLSYAQYMIDNHLILFFVEALTDYVALSEEEFDFKAGDWIAVWRTCHDKEWNGILLDEARYDPKRTLFNSRLVCMNDRLPPVPDNFRGPVLARIGSPCLRLGHPTSIQGRKIIGHAKTVAFFDYGVYVSPGEEIAVTAGDPQYMWSGLVFSNDNGGYQAEAHEMYLPRTILEWPEIPFTRLATLRHGGHEDGTCIPPHYSDSIVSNEEQFKPGRETSRSPRALWERVVKRK